MNILWCCHSPEIWCHGGIVSHAKSSQVFTRYWPKVCDKIWAGRSGTVQVMSPVFTKLCKTQPQIWDKTIPLPISWLLWTKHLNSADGCKWVHFLKQSCKKNKSHDLIQFKILHCVMMSCHMIYTLSHNLHNMITWSAFCTHMIDLHKWSHIYTHGPMI